MGWRQRGCEHQPALFTQRGPLFSKIIRACGRQDRWRAGGGNAISREENQGGGASPGLGKGLRGHSSEEFIPKAEKDERIQSAIKVRRLESTV